MKKFAIALVAICLPVAAGHAQSGLSWKYGDSEDFEACWAVSSYDHSSGAKAWVQIESNLDGHNLIMVERNDWKMQSPETTAKIVAGATTITIAGATTYHQIDGVTHLDISLTRTEMARLGKARIIRVTTADGKIAESFPLPGNVPGALGWINECLDEMEYYLY
ncbi:MAG: hypothetical protein GW855_09365 [Erythrobacter sp.]|nr:hypothetical protein [Erythrobacter sp.]NCQ65126.1 hypothetical protein [Alphaproteobacteria bacterium]